jgi:hypothetical protein
VSDHPFAERFGAPDPAVPSGLTYTSSMLKRKWESRLFPKIGAGWYWDRFLFLFGEGLDALQPCLDAWAAHLPPADEYQIAGRNAYGTVWVEVNPNGSTDERRVAFLDLHQGKVWQYAQSDLGHCVANVFPQLKVPEFLDRRGFDDWVAAGNDAPRLDQCLAPKDVGAGMKLANLQLEDIVAAFQSRVPAGDRKHQRPSDSTRTPPEASI